MVNSTISANSAGGGGGGIFGDITFGIGVHLSNTTIAGSTAAADNNGVGDGGGIWADRSYVELGAVGDGWQGAHCPPQFFLLVTITDNLVRGV